MNVKDVLNKVLNLQLVGNLAYFAKSLILVAIISAAMKLLNKLLDKTKKDIKSEKGTNTNDDISDKDILDYVKNSKELQDFLTEVNDNYNQEKSGDINLGCNNPDYYNKKSDEIANKIENNTNNKGNSENTDGNEYIDAALTISDFDSDINNQNKKQKFKTQINDILPWLFLLGYLIINTKNLFTKSEHPSRSRGNYLQNNIRSFSIILNNPNNTKGGKFKTLIKTITGSLKIMDAIIIATLAGTFLYLKNRRKFQKDSYDSFSENLKSLSCTPADKPINVMIKSDNSKLKTNLYDFKNLANLDIITTTPNGVSFNCKQKEPNISKESFEDKLKRVEECKVKEGPPIITNINITDTQPEVITKAIIQSYSTSNFNIIVNTGSYIKANSVIGSIDNILIYSPINGYVYKTEKNKILLDNISDPDISILNEYINKLQELYIELNNVKSVLKDLYIDSFYPIMLANSSLIDDNINAEEKKRAVYKKVSSRYDIYKNNKDNLRIAHDNNITILTGQDNVKTKSENFLLKDIKDDIDKEDNTYYGSLQNLANNCIKDTYYCLPDKSEFTLIEYYINLLSETLSIYENTLTNNFRDIILSIITERYFVDKWSNYDIEEKINTVCDELGKGTFLKPTSGYFKTLYTLYNQTLTVEPVRNYLVELAKKNTDINETEKNKTIEQVMILFNFVLTINQKVNSKYYTQLNVYNATTKEANEIKTFFDNMWSRYVNIPKEIEDITKKLDDLSKTSTSYTTIQENNIKYRYYGIGKKRICPIPDESDDDYINPFSTYDFGDIEYWFKYCAFATLASVASPANGWATGIPPPIGPVQLPIVYIPIKAFTFPIGFGVIGLSICGMYLFPFVILANYSQSQLGTLSPVSANFVATIKNPQPFIPIAGDLDDNINTGIVNKVIETFKLNNNSFMAAKMNTVNSFLNSNGVKAALKIAMYLMITKDPFPKYQNLKVTNVPWLLFLYQDFAPTGGKTFGFPGFPPYPV